jgi:LPS sulfotransferase NodH
MRGAAGQLAQLRRGRRLSSRTGDGVPATRTAPLTYIICTNPRSGSWLLSEGLASTSLAGNPREWFNHLQEQQYRARWRLQHATDLSRSAYLRLARADSTSSNQVSGIKLMYYQFAELPTKAAELDNMTGLTAAQALSRLFPHARHIWLTRRDKRRQAISLFIASMTNTWWNIDGATLAQQRTSAEPAFDPYAIARLEQVLVENDAKWQAYFDGNRIDPLVIHYEDLVADYRGTIVSVLRWLGIPGAEAVQLPPPRLKRQSDARNEAWLARYTAFKSSGGPGNPAKDEAGTPVLDRPDESATAISDEWKQWVMQSKLLGSSDETIVEVLTSNGYTRDAAVSETGKAASDPVLLAGARVRQHLRKAVSLLNIQGELAALDARAGVIERRSNLSRDEFRDRYYAANRPVIMQGLLTRWRALRLWTPDYLKNMGGDELVEVMTGRDADPGHETNTAGHRHEMRFADYIDMVYSGRVTNDYYMVANNAFLQSQPGQHLLDDLASLPDYLNPRTAEGHRFLWFGPAGTVTRLHHDTSNILMAQLLGRKRFRLLPPSQWQYLYNSTGVFSDVDCEQPDLGRYPRFRHATITEFVLEAGEVLFMPVGWWHHVRALEVSMTVSFTNFLFPNHFEWE